MRTKNTPEINVYWFLSLLFCTIVLLGNVLALKITTLFGFITPAGMICFPITYALGDIITDIYGYKACKRIIITSLVMLSLFVGLLSFSRLLPNNCLSGQCEAYNSIFSMSFRVFAGTVAGYLTGELLNSRTMSFLKYFLNGKDYTMRAIMATATGITIDSVVFNLVAFGGIIPWADFLGFMGQQVLLKFSFCVVLSFLSKVVIVLIRRHEGIDVYDNYRWIDKYT